MKRTAMKPHRPKMTPEERRTRRVVKARSGGLCELCGREATQMHHRRKAGRDWTPANVLHVCGLGNYSGCHGHIERNPTAAKEQGWWLLPHQDPTTAPVWVVERGRVLLLNDGTIELEAA